MTSLESLAGGQGLAVDVGKIERELTALWKAAAESSREGGSPAVTHASLLNLVIYCHGTDQVPRVQDTIGRVARARPSRVLLAVVDPASPGTGLRASISAHCSFTPGAGRGKQVCCEQITMRVSIDAVRHLPGAVLPLLLPDLPVVLWYPGDPEMASPAARRLIDSADLLVVDSRRLIAVARRFGELARLASPVSDLGWHRLRGWREVTAGIFDDPSCEAHSSRIEGITVDYPGHSNGGGAPGLYFAEAMLLGCWVAGQLGWTPSGLAAEPSDGSRVFTLATPGGKRGKLMLVAGGGEQAGILGLKLEAADARFAVRQGGSSETLSVSVEIPGNSPEPRTARMVERDEATLLCRALESAAGDAVHMRALDLASRLLGRAAPAGVP